MSKELNTRADATIGFDDDDEAADIIREQQAEIERLRKDAERYRWLRDTRTDRFGETKDGTFNFAIRDCSLPRAESLDAAIDAAITKEKEHG